MQVLDNHTGEAITNVVQESINEKSIVFTDKSSSYIDICKYVEGHLMEKSNAQVTKETLQLVHIAISNAKRIFLGVFHKIKGSNLQRYLKLGISVKLNQYLNLKLFKNQFLEPPLSIPNFGYTYLPVIRYFPREQFYLSLCWILVLIIHLPTNIRNDGKKGKFMI